MRPFKAEETKYVCPKCHATLSRLIDVETKETVEWVCRNGHVFSLDSSEINALIAADELLT